MNSKRWMARALTIAMVGLGGSLSATTSAQADPVVPINWKVDASTTIKKLNQTVVVPTGSFNGVFDLGTSSLTGDLALPQADKRLDIGTLPLATVTFAMKQAAPISGTVDLATMQAQTTATFNVRIVSIRPVLAPWLNLVAPRCQTRTPVVAQIGGKVDLSAPSTFSGTYDLPRLSGCGLAVTPILNAVMSGPGNTLTATFTP